MEAYSSLHANEYCANIISIPVRLAVGTHQTSWRETRVHYSVKQGHLPGPSEIPNKPYTRIQGSIKATMSLRQRFSYSWHWLAHSLCNQKHLTKRSFGSGIYLHGGGIRWGGERLDVVQQQSKEGEEGIQGKTRGNVRNTVVRRNGQYCMETPVLPLLFGEKTMIKPGHKVSSIPSLLLLQQSDVCSLVSSKVMNSAKTAILTKPSSCWSRP